MKRGLALLALVVFVCFTTVSLSTHAMAAEAKTTLVEGVLQKVDGQYQVQGRKGTFAVTGQDFSALEGKMVQATGKMTRGPKGDVLKVESIKEIVPKKK